MKRRGFLRLCLDVTVSLALPTTLLAIYENLTSYERAREYYLSYNKLNSSEITEIPEPCSEVYYWNDSDNIIEVHAPDKAHADKVFRALETMKNEDYEYYRKFIDIVRKIKYENYDIGDMWVDARDNSSIYINLNESKDTFNFSDNEFLCAFCHEKKHLDGYGEVVAYLEYYKCLAKHLF